MEGRLSVSLFLATLFLLAGCTPPAGEGSATRLPLQETALRTLQPTSPPATATATQTQTAATTSAPAETAVPRGDKTGIAAVDTVIEAMLGNDLEQSMSLVRLVTSGCTTADGLGGPPKCTEGQEEGALVEYLPLGGPGEGSHVLAAEVAGVLAFEVESLYAVYRVADNLPDEPEYPRGTYVLFFRTAGGDAGSETRIVRVDDAGAIVRLDSIGMMPVDLYFQQMVADLLDSPPESSMFSSEAAEILLYPPEMQPGAGGATGAGARPTPTPVVNDGQSADPRSTPSPTAHAPPPAELPGTLYFLSTEHFTSSAIGQSQGVWRLEPGGTAVERITDPDLDITSFDLWQGDGRIAYGTGSGQIYTILPNGKQRLLHDAGLDAGSDIEIGSLAWSPDGTGLAFTVNYAGGDPAGEEGGLWLLDQNDGAPVKLLDNIDLDPELGNVNEVRMIVDVDWSPDGSALLLRFGFWEHQDIQWLTPIIPDPSEANLHDPPSLWTDGSWARDSQSILLSGMDRAQFSNLDRVNIETEDVERLVVGEKVRMAIFKAQELPTGPAFLAGESSLADATRSYRIYLGQQLADGFQYAPLGPDHALCSPGFVWDINWDPEGQVAAVSCDRGVELVSLDGTIDLDLTPYLGPLAGGNLFKVFWGRNES